MDTITEFKTINGLVLKLLETEERCRNDDKYLTYRVFEIISRNNGFNGIFIPFNIWDKFPAFETVKRCRANIQNKQHRFEPTSEDVKSRRQRRQKEVPFIMNGVEPANDI